MVESIVNHGVKNKMRILYYLIEEFIGEQKVKLPLGLVSSFHSITTSYVLL